MVWPCLDSVWTESPKTVGWNGRRSVRYRRRAKWLSHQTPWIQKPVYLTNRTCEGFENTRLGRSSPQSLWDAEEDGRTEDTRPGTGFGRLRSFLIPVFHYGEPRVNDDSDGRQSRVGGHNILFDSRGGGDGAEEAQNTVWFKVGGRWSCSTAFFSLSPFFLLRTGF